jgi:hypothetical protein
VSTTSTNIAIASRAARRRLKVVPSPGSVVMLEVTIPGRATATGGPDFRCRNEADASCLRASSRRE